MKPVASVVVTLRVTKFLAQRPVGNALRGVPRIAMDAVCPSPGTPRRAFPTALALFIAFSTLGAGSACAQPAPAPYLQAVDAPNLKGVGFDQRLNQPIPLDLTFRDENGRPVRLGDFFKGKPVVLVLAYYRCPMLCTLVLNGVAAGIMKVPLAIGKDFQVVTVSFDPREKPALAAAKKEKYIERYDQPGAKEGWHFLTGQQDAIDKLTHAAGFRYVYDAKHDQFIHPTGIIVVTPSGKISRYLYGIDFAPRDLRLALVEASESKIGSPTDQVLLYCFCYDPAAGKYTANVMMFVRAGGALTLVGVVSLVWLLRRRRRQMVAHADPYVDASLRDANLGLGETEPRGVTEPQADPGPRAADGPAGDAS